MFFFQPGAIAKDLNDHSKILDLIKSEQLEEAEHLMKAHLEYQRKKLMKTISRFENPDENAVKST